MKKIITVQHTQSIHHTNGMVGSWTDWELSQLGIQQANKIGENLKNELKNKEIKIYSSDLIRAKQTAQIIGEYLNVPSILKKELRERNLGECCGKSVEWLRENMEVQEKTIDDRMFSDSESRRDEWNRLEPFFSEVMTNNEETIVIVSHGDLLSVFNIMFLGLDIETINEFEIFGLAGGVSHLIINDSGKKYIKRMSDMSYIK